MTWPLVHSHPDRCHWKNCPQGSAHHPHDWMKEVGDDEPDWYEYLTENSARERDALYCGVCHEQWPCLTKLEHLAARGKSTA